MTKFKPYWITSSQDSSLSIVPGQFVVHTDTGEAFVDINNNTRKSISGGSSSEIETNLTEAQIKALTSHPKAIYIASDTHGIWYYNNGWVNLDTDTHQNAFGIIKVGSTDVVADSSEDTLTLVEGSNIALTPNATNDSVTISATGVATAAQGEKADSAVQNITINGSSAGISKSNNRVDLPAYPTTLPASDTTDTYSSSGTTPVSGKAVAAALGTLGVTGDSNISASKTIESWTEVDGKINIETQNISITHDQISDAGNAITKNYTASVSQNNGALVTSGAVYDEINKLPKPMVMRGTLGAIADGGKIQELPTTSLATVGDTYKVVTAGTYALQTAKVGDLFTLIEETNNTKSWLYIPSGDDIEDTHRVIKLNETEILGNDSVPLNLKNGDFVSITSSQNATTGNMDVTIAHRDTSSQSSVSNSGRTYIQSVTLDSAGHVTGLSSATETVTNTDTYVNGAGFAHDDNYSNIEMTLWKNDNSTVKAHIPKISSSTSGVVPKGNSVSSQSQSTKFLREDGTWAAPSYTTYSTATQSANGLMSSADKKKLDGVATGATANTGTVTKVSTGSGLTGGDITSTGTVKANLRSETKFTNDSAAATETSGRVYPVALDKSGYLAVNVPWSDTKVKLTDSEPSNSSTLNCIPFSSTHNGTAVELNSNSAFGYYGKNGSASEEGSACLSLGNATAKGTANNKTGSVCLYSDETGYGYLKQSSTADVLNHYLPAVSGTLLNSGNYSNYAAPASHTHPSSDIISMTGYVKASSAAGITTSDSLNTAIGKLEKTLDGKGTSNLTLGTTSTTAAKGDHAHGSITNAGAITGTTALANGDGLIFADSSDSSKLKRSTITIGTGTNTYLRNDGTWATPSMPTVNNGVLTIQKNGTQVTTFSANQSGNTTANITVPTKVSDLTNDSGFVTSSGVTSVATGVGLTGGTISSTGTIKANLRSETKLTNNSAAATETSGRVYPVALDKSGYLAVNVPWSNTKVKLTDFEPSSGTTYCIPFSSTHDGTAVELNSNSAIAYYGKNGTTSADGVACLSLGNAIASGTANNKEGKLWLYSPNSGGCYLKQQATTNTVNHTFPTTSGTVLNSGTTSYTATTSSGTTGAYEIGKIKINGTETTIYGKDNNTKVTSVIKNPTTATTYSVPFSPDNTSNDNIFINDGLRYIVREGTASSEGLASFRVGNATATGTAGNKSGDIRIFNGTGKSVVLTYESGAGTSYYQFRNTGGNAEPYTLLDSGVDIRNSYARKFSLSGSDTANTSGWYQIAEATITGYSNCHGVFAVYNTYQKETQFGIFKISLRCNNTSNTFVNDFTWVTRENGWTYDYICYVIDGNKVKLYVYKDVGQYGRIMAELLSESSITSGNSAWTMVNSTSPTGGTSMSSKVYPVERCFGAGTKTISTASAKNVSIKIKGIFFRSGTQFYTAGLLKFHFNTAKLTSSSYTYGDYTYGSYNVSGNDSWIAVNGTSVTTLSQITSTIDSSSDTTAGAQTREVTLTIALSSSSFVTVEYDPQVYTVSQ